MITFIKNDFRSFEATFWSIIFPLILYFVLNSIFGNLATSSSLELRLGVIKQEELSGFGKIIDEVLDAVSSGNGPFVITNYEDVEKAIEDLKNEKEDVLLVIPKGTNAKLTGSLLLKNLGLDEATLEVYYVESRQTSRISSEILEQIFNEVNLEIAKRTGKDLVDFEVVKTLVSKEKKSTFRYKEYIFPGIVLMLIISVSLFNLNLGLSYNRTSGINKKLYTTPIKPLQYFSSYVLAMIILMMIALILLYSFALLLYKVNASLILNFRFVAAILFSMITMLSFGMMISSIFKKASTAMVVSQIVNQLLMFLGGLYFPIFNVPWVIRWLVYVLPTTYLAELLRSYMGYSVSTIPSNLLFAIPLVWMASSITIFSLNFKKVMGYE